jgi:hypothetical protein
MPTALVGVAPEQLPHHAHVQFACPLCQLQQQLVPLSTDAAAEVAWEQLEGELPDALLRATFTGIRCPACHRSFTLQVQRDLRQPATSE